MKKIFMVFDNKTNHIIGAYSSIEEMAQQILCNVNKMLYGYKDIYTKDEEVPDEAYNRIIETFGSKIKTIWN